MSTYLIAAFFLCVIQSVAVAQDNSVWDADKKWRLADYLPKGVEYNSSIPQPQQVLGYEVGDFHVRHDQLVSYFEILTQQSDRVSMEYYGFSHEMRPLFVVYISDPKNLSQLSELKDQHIANIQKKNLSKAELAAAPGVVWMGYSVHGNESSGSNAAMLAAYHLAASESKGELEYLKNQITIIDPCLNPDGLSRFAHWANVHKGKALVADPRHREHNEVWPGGRTNHYWFDLNRDWLLLTHPESRGRVRLFHEWRPNVLTDFHEMGTDATYFFQPGVLKRKNPLTPDENVRLTKKIASYHAKSFDEKGELYYSEERFDDFYYGKGSTYPDVHGCIGILFEQASSRGHLQDSAQGPLSFGHTIQNQLTTSLSTFKAAHDMREELLEYQRKVQSDALNKASADGVKAFVFGGVADRARLNAMVSILRQHQIQVHKLGQQLKGKAHDYSPENSYLIVLKQNQYSLIRSLFEEPKTFPDHVFYDVSSWNIAHAFNVPFEALASGYEALLGELVERDLSSETASQLEPAYAYAFDWNSYYAPRAAARLLKAGVKLRVATTPIRALTSTGEQFLAQGSIMVPMGIQTVAHSKIMQTLGEIAAHDFTQVHSLRSGWTTDGVDLGSPSMKPVKKIKPLLVVGPGVRAYDAGEVWHLLDQHYDMPVSLIEGRQFAGLDLERYTHIILVEGAGSAIGSQGAKVQKWVKSGGVLIAMRSAVKFAQTQVLKRAASSASKAKAKTRAAKTEQKSGVHRHAYREYEDRAAVHLVRGAVFQAEMDLSHPLCFGLSQKTMALFRTSSLVLEVEKDPFSMPVCYSVNPWLCGYASKENVEKIAASPAVIANRLGSGCVIRFADNTNFRGYWYGSSKLFANALFFGPVIKHTQKIKTPAEGGGEEQQNDEHHH